MRTMFGPRAVTLATLVAVPLLTTTGCIDWQPPHEPGAVALVVGGRNNMPVPELTPEAVRLITDAAASRDTLVIVGVSSKPEVLYTENIVTACDSEVACDGFGDDYLKKINGLLTSVRAASPEADTLGAILTAAHQLDAVKKPGPKQIVVIDNGLQTAGEIQMHQPGAFAVDIGKQVEQFKNGELLAELKEMRILLTGLGSTHQPQEPLSPDAVKQLEKLWKAVLGSGQATVDIDPSPLSGQSPPADLPHVSIVPLSDPMPPPATCMRLREDQVGFLPDQAVFRDHAAAKAVLAEIAKVLKSANIAITVIGTTAWPEGPSSTLSRDRANAVIAILVGLGVDRANLTGIGVGTKFSGYKHCLTANGTRIETCAVQNRLVIIQPAGSSC